MNGERDPQPVHQSADMVGPLVAGALVQLVVLVFLRHIQVPGDWMRWLGSAVVAILPVGLILWFGFGRRFDPRGWWKIPLLLWPLSLIVLLPPAPDTVDYWRVGMSIADASQRILDDDPDWPGTATPPRPGEIGEIDRIALAFGRHIVADRRAYRRDRDATGISRLLSPERLRTRADLADARRRLEAAMGVVRRYRDLSASRLVEIRGQLQRAPIGEAAKAELLRGLADGEREAGALANHIWVLEFDILSAHTGLLDVLERGRWTRAGEAFQFAAPADRADFDTRLEDIRAAREEQDELSAQRRLTIDDMMAGTPL